ncbi:GIY-YIG nuclease family protein [Croceiramulus getboli]|nr:GIY-YIG nuclease family protein [Flavobacteriaceae bacterium YJPT1-3]
MYFVYVIESQIDGRLYKGLSENVARRLRWHNQGKSKSTRGYRPWILVYEEEVGDLRQARAREKYLKSGSGREELKLLIEKWPRSSAE